MTYRAIRCPCHERGCTAWHVEGVAQVLGVSFTETQAEAVATLLNAMKHRVVIKGAEGARSTTGAEIIEKEILPYLRLMATPKGWKPIDTAPRSGHGCPRCYVLVRGPSRMAGTEHFVVKAYRDAEHRPLSPWLGVDGEPLSDFGWEPTEWMEIPE